MVSQERDGLAKNLATACRLKASTIGSLTLVLWDVAESESESFVGAKVEYVTGDPDAKSGHFRVRNRDTRIMTLQILPGRA